MQTIVETIGLLSPLPPTATKLAGVVASNSSTVDDIVDVVKYDQAITMEVLRYANSAFSASSRRIVSLRDAVIRLGGARILEQCVARHVRDDMRAPLSAYGYAEDELWRHSVASALAAELLGSYADAGGDGLSFTASLLHDVGKLILARTAPEDDMLRIWSRISSGASPCPCEQAERDVFGFSHAGIGAKVTKQWQLPVEIVDAIEFHHDLAQSLVSVTDIVRISNIVAKVIGEGIGNEGMSLAADIASATRVGLSKESFEKLCAATAIKLREVLEAFEV